MAKSSITTMDALYKGLFASPENQPEWARKAWAERAELERTGKRVLVRHHLDNCGAGCRNVGTATLVYDMQHHDCCFECNEAGDLAAKDPAP